LAGIAKDFASTGIDAAKETYRRAGASSRVVKPILTWSFTA
jgi:hypothetical protein